MWDVRDWKKTQIVIKSKKEGNLLTIDAFKEMIVLDKVISEHTYNNESFTSRCLEFQDSTRPQNPCRMDAKPIDFVYDKQSDSYDLDKFKTDKELLEQIQRGRT